jgi:catechol 2,3-dioxygenase-like lactoylglutathione lyase family enzyme
MTTATLPNVPNKTPEGATDIWKFHASLNVGDLARSITFYRAMLGAEPVKFYENYAKFEIDVPPLILSLKPQPAKKGGPLNHLGLRVKTTEELLAIQARLESVGAKVARQDDVRCCYAHQTKFWVADPDETLWEIYVLHADFSKWGEGSKFGLMMPPLRALGFFGSIRRALSKPFQLFGRKPAGEPAQPKIPASELTVPIAGSTPAANSAESTSR